ncbi:MAG: hypothetical protein ABIK09_04530 [Pseudomonadota bacterium]
MRSRDSCVLIVLGDHRTMWWILPMALLLFDPAPVSGFGAEILISPRTPVVGETVRVLAVAEASLGDAAVIVEGPGVPARTLKARRGGGPPWWWLGEIDLSSAGEWRVRLVADGRDVVVRAVTVVGTRRPRPRSPLAWETERAWGRGTENLYAAWVELLFDRPEGTHWPGLHHVTRDRGLNVLHGYLGLGEDDDRGPDAFEMYPDCADNPYFLRAYFAWKLGLPFGYHGCTRGTLRRPPACDTWTSNRVQRAKGSEGEAFRRFLRRMKGAVHASSARTPLASEATDLYPVPLTRDAMRPGTVYPDPYGHTFMLVRWIPQDGDEPGILLAADAQPDHTVEIKRFWRGNFLFDTRGVIGGPGFKAWRPVVEAHGELRSLTNGELGGFDSRDFAPLSMQQADMDPTAFYDTMDRAINPAPQDPVRAYRLLHEALHQQLVTRVRAVDLGAAWLRAHRDPIPMPEGPAIFRTGGPWEDVSTPARDLRLLVAIDAVLDFPNRLLRTPDAFRIPAGKSAEEIRGDLDTLSRLWRTGLSVSYPRSDGSEVTLSLADVIARAEALELGWNPNDCAEIRWGAAPGSDEARTCRIRAPQDQRKKMQTYRAWFTDRRRPAW